jgi:AmmeMemoRadiSam system protein A
MQDAASVGPELCRIARDAIREHLATGARAQRFEADAPRAGVFVTLRNPDGSLRGCVGSIEPVESDVRNETARSAVLAATRDPRFPPVSVEEVERLGVEVSVLLPEEPIADATLLDPAIYGVIVRNASGRRGLLLPAIPGIESAERQLALALEKARIPPGEPYTLSRFRVQKWDATMNRATRA